MGPDGDPNYAAYNPAVAYNGAANEYLVAWEGNDDTPPMLGNEYEVFGQRLRGATGAQVGVNDFRLSDMGPDRSPNFGAAFPAAASTGTNNECLVGWMGDDMAAGEYEIFGQRLKAATGAEVGANDFLISNMGPNDISSSDFAPAVAYNSVNN